MERVGCYFRQGAQEDLSTPRKNHAMIWGEICQESEPARTTAELGKS